MKFYTITVRVSEEAVRLAQAIPEAGEPPLSATEVITEEHLKLVGEIAANEIQNEADTYGDEVAAYVSSSGPTRERGGVITGTSGPLANLARQSERIGDLQREILSLERGHDDHLNTFMQEAPRCWDGDSAMDALAFEYLRHLEAALGYSGHNLAISNRHRPTCDGEC